MDYEQYYARLAAATEKGLLETIGGVMACAFYGTSSERPVNELNITVYQTGFVLYRDTGDITASTNGMRSGVVSIESASQRSYIYDVEGGFASGKNRSLLSR